MQRLVVNVRGPKEAIEAAKGGADIPDAGDPRSTQPSPCLISTKAIPVPLNKAESPHLPISIDTGKELIDCFPLVKTTITLANKMELGGSKPVHHIDDISFSSAIDLETINALKG